MNPDIVQDLALAQATAEAEQPFSTAYLVHDTVWGLGYISPLKVYLSRHEAEVARDAAEELTSPSTGWVVTPFSHDGALGDTVRLDVRSFGHGEPYSVGVSLDGRVVAEVYQSDLPY